MAQLTMNAHWTLKLDHSEMKLVTLALAGKLKGDDMIADARQLLERMTRARLAVVSEQAEHLKRFIDTGETE